MKYFSIGEILTVCIVFFSFGGLSRLVVSALNCLYRIMKTFVLRILKFKSASFYVSNMSKIATIRKALSALLEAIFTLIISFIFFLLSYYHLDGQIRFYTVLLSVLGYTCAYVLLKCIKKCRGKSHSVTPEE